MTGAAPSFADFTDADLAATLRRAIRTVTIAGLVLFIAISLFSGWQSGALLLIGALISAIGLWEARRLIAVVNAKLDRQASPRSTGFVVATFLFRLFIAGAVLYISLRYLHGSVYALFAGLLLAIVALSIEAIRLLKN